MEARPPPLESLAAERQGRSNPVRGVQLACGLLVVLVVGLGAWMLSQSYETELREVGQSTGNQSVILGESVRQLVRSADAFLSTASAQLEFDAAGHLSNAAAMRTLLADWSERLPLVASFVFAAADGQRIIDTRYPGLLEGPDATKTQTYAWARDDRSLKLGIVGPGRTAVGNQPYVISLVRRVEDRDHRFLGLIAQVFEVDALGRYFAQVDLGKSSAITLFRMIDDGSSGVVLARQPANPDMVGQTISRSSPTLRWIVKTPEYQIGKSTRNADGVDRMFALRELPDYGLAIVVARPWADVIGPWYSRAVLVVLAMIVVVFVVVGVMVALIRQVNAKIEVERRAGAALAERRRAELDAQSSKLDAMARLSGGVAHEFNNLLQPIKTLSELGRGLVATGGNSSERLEQYFARIHETASMASAIAADFLTFCGTNKRPIHQRSLSAAVRDAADQIAALVPADAELQMEISPGIRAEFDDVGLIQILVNLVKNAVEAARPVAKGRVPLRITVAVSRSPSGEAVLCVSDNGPGMSDTVRVRAFEPFFTTKGPAGTGLGLAVVYGIVTAWGGRIDVESVPGAGAAFTITIPAVDARQPEPADAARSPAA